MAGKFIIYLYLLMFWSGYELNVTLVFRLHSSCPSLTQKRCDKERFGNVMEKHPGRGEGRVGRGVMGVWDAVHSRAAAQLKAGRSAGGEWKSPVCVGNLWPKIPDSAVKVQHPGHAMCLTRQITARGRNNHSIWTVSTKISQKHMSKGVLLETTSAFHL